MRLLSLAPEITMWVLIVAAALVNVAIYTGVVQGEDAVDLRVESRETGPQARSTPAGETTASRAILAETDASPDLPGRFVPTQGRQHTRPYGQGDRVEYCPDNEVRDDCYASRPPTSGLHLPVQRSLTLADGNVVDLPPEPGIYDFEIPRETIPHIQEYAGVYVGYTCRTEACQTAVAELREVVLEARDHGERVVMAPSSDLGDDVIGLASWTRVESFSSAEYTDERALRFIEAHSCRFDPEGFCQ
jgi:hypothetical protein